VAAKVVDRVANLVTHLEAAATEMEAVAVDKDAALVVEARPTKRVATGTVHLAPSVRSATRSATSLYVATAASTTPMAEMMSTTPPTMLHQPRTKSIQTGTPTPGLPTTSLAISTAST
jgi:hypothetical protein